MGRVKTFRSGITDLWNIIQVVQGIWPILSIAGLSVVAEMLMAWAGASPLQAIALSLLFAMFLVLCLIAYRLYWLNVSIEFKPSEHPSYFYEWGFIAEDEDMLATFLSRPLAARGWLARIRLRVYSGDTVEGVKVALTEVIGSEKLKGILPFNLRFKDDSSTPLKTSIDLHPDDDQFVDVVSWQWHGNDIPTIVFHAASIGDQEVPLKPYEIKLRVSGKNIRSETKKLWIGIGEEDKPELGIRKGLFPMRLLDD
ncbi:MAG: hypothetical protein NDI90_08415 [Nitrospira sp. BO4]|jgi:hypothetical protein|nr:hypothetical protein [Nitrospira sp. BO4]